MMSRAIVFAVFCSTGVGCAPPSESNAPHAALGDDAAETVGTSEDDGKADGTSTTRVFLNFGGATLHYGAFCSDAPRNCTSLIKGDQTFAPMVVGADYDRVKVVAAVSSCVATYFSDMNVEVVTTRPASGPYTMMVIGAGYPRQLGFPDGGGPYGRAPLDCGNSNRNDIGFILLADAVDHDYDFMCRSIAHELGHTFGLVHTKGPNASARGRTDAMCEQGSCFDGVANGRPWDFQNKTMEAENRACDWSWEQNSYALLTQTLGVHGH